MKIGIISIHSAHNYGSVLQAYALQEELKKFSDEVEIINYRPDYLEEQYQMFSLRIYRRYKGFLNKLLHLAWRITMLIPRYTKYKKFENYIKMRYNLTRRYSTYEQLENAKLPYDVLICGSDQIWNTDITEGFDKTYYLGFADEKIVKASYAASIGKKQIDTKYEKEYQEYLPKLDHIALREEASKKMIEKYTDKPIAITIDPTLLHTKKEWDVLADTSKLEVVYPYLLVYILEENQEFVKIVNELSQYLKLKVVSLSKKKRFKNETIFPNAGPEDFVKLFKNAEFVITNSFHGTAFSIIYQKRNCIIPHQEKGERMCHLMRIVGLENRIIRSCEELKLAEITKEINYEEVTKRLNSEIQNAENYIRNVLNKDEGTKKGN